MGSAEMIQRDMNRAAARKLRELADALERGDAGVFDWEEHQECSTPPAVSRLALTVLQVRFVKRPASAPLVSGEHR
jgi:hypothetical protein